MRGSVSWPGTVTFRCLQPHSDNKTPGVGSSFVFNRQIWEWYHSFHLTLSKTLSYSPPNLFNTLKMNTTDHCFPTEQCSLVFIYLFMVWSAEADFLHAALFSLNPKNSIFAYSTPVLLCLFSRSLNPRFKPSCTGHACRAFEDGWQRQNKSYKSSSVLNSHANRIKTQQLLCEQLKLRISVLWQCWCWCCELHLLGMKCTVFWILKCHILPAAWLF